MMMIRIQGERTKPLSLAGHGWHSGVERGGGGSSLNFIRLLRVVITPPVTSESTGR